MNTKTLSTNAPAAPTGFGVVSCPATQINLTWNSVSNATSYVVERSLDGRCDWTAVPLANPSLPSSPFFKDPKLADSRTDTSVVASTTYYYRIKTVNANGSSVYSSVLSATTAAVVPDTGDTLATAKAVTFSSDSFSITEKINGLAGTKDIDIYKITVASSDVGKKFEFSASMPAFGPQYAIDTTGALPLNYSPPALDTYVRLFNSSGTQIAYNDNASSEVTSSYLSLFRQLRAHIIWVFLRKKTVLIHQPLHQVVLVEIPVIIP